MNIKRLVTTLIGLPLAIAIVLLANKYIADVLFAVMAICAMYEYIKCSSKKAKPVKWISYLCMIVIAFIHIIPQNFVMPMLVFSIPFLLFVLFLQIIITNMKTNFMDIAYTLIGIMYIFGFIIFLPIIYGIEGDISGKILILFVLFSAWGTDIFAYLVGNRLKMGKTKFSKVSPNKSVEGCIAGIAGSIITNLILTCIVNIFAGCNISYLTIIILSAILSIIGQVGDFAASSIKRYFEVKDFSELFPGHGGMLDRIDSLMFIAPFAYLLISLFLI